MLIELAKVDTASAQRIIELSGTDVLGCYQCGECSSGCPSAFAMDILPNQINAFLALGDGQTVLNSKTIWLCVACFQCESRCPHGIDVAKVAEAARQFLLRKDFDKIQLWRDLGEEKLPAVAVVGAGRKFTA